MRKVFLMVGAVALAASMPALAQKGGKGGGGNGGGHAAHGQGGGGGGGGKAAHGGGGGHGGGPAQAAKPAKAERQAFQGGGKPQKMERQAFRAPKPQKAERQASHAAKPQNAERKFVQQAAKRDARVQRDFARGEVRRDDYRSAVTYAAAGAGYAAAQNCPPGLAKKGNGCMPPGQARKAYGVGERVEQDWFGGYDLPSRYSAFYADTPQYYYGYDDSGYIYRVDRQTDLISGLVPLLGGGFSVGQALPAGYDVYNVPYQYRDDYYDTDEAYYRYGDDAIYEVDPQSGMIESIVALLGGDDFGIGQQLPAGYDAYNLPMEYRDEYQDTDENMYRYADGNIYEVDTKTQIIQAIMEMLV
ncbi:MAG TPA: hypothetical protein VF655_10395 [Allosphingosinicella sp.]|jgi:hypothetical protein